MDNRKEISVDEVRKILFDCRRKLMNKKANNNRLSKKYLSKMQYMIMWLGLIPINKNVLDNWIMPDYGDIIKMKKFKKEMMKDG